MNCAKTSASMPGLLMGCSSDRVVGEDMRGHFVGAREARAEGRDQFVGDRLRGPAFELGHRTHRARFRSEEHTSELQSLMRISYAVLCLKKKNKTDNNTTITLILYE